MSLVVSDKGGSDYEPIPAGTHHAVCYRIWDLGTQDGGKFDPRRQILIAWELPDQRIEVDGDDLPKSLSRRFTHSLHKKSALRPFLEMWRGRAFTEQEAQGFDLENLIGANCMLQVMHKENNGKTFANVMAAMPLMKGFEKLDPENETLCWSLEDRTSIPSVTPEWVQKLIENSAEWKKRQNDVWGDDASRAVPNVNYENQEDDVPF
jgi:hypothetical protein